MRRDDVSPMKRALAMFARTLALFAVVMALVGFIVLAALLDYHVKKSIVRDAIREAAEAKR